MRVLLPAARRHRDNKMSVDAAHKSQWEIAEVVFGLPFLVGVVLHFVFPLPLPAEIGGLILRIAGIVLIVASIVLITLARRELASFNQPTDPGQTTSKIVRTGVFAISRNPLYLSAVMLFGGLALAFNLLWAALMVLLSIGLCHFILIVPEERYLAAKFGDEYKAYTAGVQRWIGRK